MTPQELKASILQLAIQGKLVEQRPEEGTGAELLEKILAAKGVKGANDAGKILTRRRGEKAASAASSSLGCLVRPGYPVRPSCPGCPRCPVLPADAPFDIPESWVWVMLGEVADSIQYGYNASAKESGRIKMVRISDIHDDKVSWERVPYCDILGKDIPSYLLTPNDILFARTGGTVGKSYLVREVPQEAIYAGYLIRVRFRSGLLMPSYAKFFMDSPLYWAQLREGTIATAQPNCNGKTLSKMLFPLPPLAEQKRIVAKIEELLPYIDRYEKAWSKLEDFNKRFPGDMQKSLLQMAIQGKLVDQCLEEGTGEELYHQIQSEKQRLIKSGKIKKEKPLPEITPDEIPFDIPDNWKWVRFGCAITLLSGTDFNPEEYNDQMRGVPYITGASNISESGVYVNRWTESPRVVANRDDVLLVCKGSGYGKTVICDIDKAHIARQIMAIKYSRLLSMQYVRYFLMANVKLIKSRGQGVIPGVDRGSILHFLFPLPPLAEQKRIVAKLEELLPLCERLK